MMIYKFILVQQHKNIYHKDYKDIKNIINNIYKKIIIIFLHFNYLINMELIILILYLLKIKYVIINMNY